MKKSYVFVILFAVSMVFIACNKNDDDLVVQKQDDTSMLLAPSDWGAHRYTEPYWTYCLFPGVNCFDDIVFKPKLSELTLAQRTLIDFIAVAYTNDKVKLEEFVSDNFKLLSNYIIAEHLQMVLEQQLQVTAKRNDEKNIDMLIFLQKDELYRAYPVIIDIKD